MRSSVGRISLVCAIVLVSALLIVIAAYPRTATGAAQPAASAVTAPVAQSVEPVDSALPADPSGPQFSGLAPASGVGTPPPPVNGVPGYMWNYSAKFVCGRQKFPDANPGEPPVKPGNYATEINIHNYNYRGFQIRKKVVLVVDHDQVIGREPQQQGPRFITTTDIGPDFVMMDDCNAIWGMVNQIAPTTPMPLMIGYLVVISPLDLDIDAVYTAAEPGEPNSAVGTTAITAISIDVNRVLGKRVFVPLP